MEEPLTKRSNTKPLGWWAIVIAVLVIAILIVPIFWLSHLLFFCQSEQTIQAKLLKDTPLGSSMDEVAQYIERKGWRRDTSHREHLGFYKHGSGKEAVVVGSKSFEVELEITIIYEGGIRVTAYWGFDEEGKLIEVWVEKLVYMPGQELGSVDEALTKKSSAKAGSIDTVSILRPDRPQRSNQASRLLGIRCSNRQCVAEVLAEEF